MKRRDAPTMQSVLAWLTSPPPPPAAQPSILALTCIALSLRPRADAKGRKLKIVKVPCPPAIFRTYREAGGLLVSLPALLCVHSTALSPAHVALIARHALDCASSPGAAPRHGSPSRSCFFIFPSLCLLNFSLFQPDHYDKGYTPRIPGERLSASYINHYKANGGAVLSKVGAPPDSLCVFVVVGVVVVCVCVGGGGGGA
jgi:agmatine/peptidylarginine deiminase